MKIVSVIPTHNRRLDIRQLCLMLRNANIPAETVFEVVCVVDGSTDGTEEMLKEEFPEVRLIKGSGNWWYTKSMNEGIKYALDHLAPDLILCLNDDVELESNYLNNLVGAYKKVGGNCLMGSISLSIEQPYVISFSGTREEEKFPFRWIPYIKSLSAVDISELTGIYPSKELPGRGMLVPSYILRELELLDEAFPQYHSDFDFCLRASRKGYKIYVSYDAVLYSHVMKTSSSTTFKKISTIDFLKNFVNPYSRKHARQNARYIWRHKNKLLFPFFFLKWLLLVVANHVRVNISKPTTRGV